MRIPTDHHLYRGWQHPLVLHIPPHEIGIPVVITLITGLGAPHHPISITTTSTSIPRIAPNSTPVPRILGAVTRWIHIKSMGTRYYMVYKDEHHMDRQSRVSTTLASPRIAPNSTPVPRILGSSIGTILMPRGYGVQCHGVDGSVLHP